MIQSISFGNRFDTIPKLIGKNTYEDWQLIATDRPVVAPPTPKTILVDVPGGSGMLDMSEALSGYPVYNNRTGSFTFRVMNKKTPVYPSTQKPTWSEHYSEIMKFLHGRAMRMVLADDPEWFYYGRYTVDAWGSNSENTWSTITIGYNVGPFKWHFISSTEPWIWDPFNFETGIIWEQTFKGITINNAGWVSFTWPSAVFGDVPISPTLTVSGASGLDMNFSNAFLGISQTIRLNNGVNVLPDVIFYGQPSYTVFFRGVGTIDFDFRVGRL